MSAAKAQIFSSLRKALSVSGADSPRRLAVAERLKAKPRGIIPARARKIGSEMVEIFVREAEASLATLTQVETSAGIGPAIGAFLRAHNLPAQVRIGEDPRWQNAGLDALPLDIRHGATAGDDVVCASFAMAGIAETGTLALLSGSCNPTTLNFLPENHVIALTAADIVACYEDAFDKITAQQQNGILPRTINFITGPSRSADIEQTLLLGAHGPLRVHIVLVGRDCT